MKEVPEALNKITDIVLAYRPKPKTKAARKRARKKPKEKKSEPAAR
jgi:hypothetical protein